MRKLFLSAVCAVRCAAGPRAKGRADFAVRQFGGMAGGPYAGYRRARTPEARRRRCSGCFEREPDLRTQQSKVYRDSQGRTRVERSITRRFIR